MMVSWDRMGEIGTAFSTLHGLMHVGREREGGRAVCLLEWRRDGRVAERVERVGIDGGKRYLIVH